MDHKLPQYLYDGKTAIIIDAIVNRRLAGQIQGIRVQRSAIIDVKKKSLSSWV